MRKNTPIPPLITPAGHGKKNIKFGEEERLKQNKNLDPKSIFVVNPLVYT